MNEFWRKKLVKELADVTLQLNKENVIDESLFLHARLKQIAEEQTIRLKEKLYYMNKHNIKEFIDE